jgi:hypothetical protein
MVPTHFFTIACRKRIFQGDIVAVAFEPKAAVKGMTIIPCPSFLPDFYEGLEILLTDAGELL